MRPRALVIAAVVSIVTPLALTGVSGSTAQSAAAATVSGSFTDLGVGSEAGPIRIYDDGSIAFGDRFYSHGVFTPAPTPPGANGPMQIDVATGSGLLVGTAYFGNGADAYRAAYWRPSTGETGAYPSPCSDVYPQKDGTSESFPEYYGSPALAGDGDEIVAYAKTCYPTPTPPNQYVTLASVTAAGTPLTGIDDNLNAHVDAINNRWILQGSAGSSDIEPETRISRAGGSSTLPVQDAVDKGALAPDGTVVGQDTTDTNVGDVVAPDGTVTRLAVPAGRIGGGGLINAAHVVVGATAIAQSADDPNFTDYAMTLWPSPSAQPVDLRPLLPAGWKNAIPFGLNNNDQIVGGALAPDGKPHVFVTDVVLHALRGQVTDGLGTPVAGATVTAVGANGFGGGTTTTAADGSYQFLLPAAAFSVSATDSKSNTYAPGVTAVDLSAGDAAVGFALVQQTLSGHVFANSCGDTACTHVGLAGVTIAVTGSSVAGTSVNLTVTTDAGGAWSQHVPRGTYKATPTMGTRGFDPENSALTVTTDISSLDYQTCASENQGETAEFRAHLDAVKLCPYKLDWTMPPRFTEAKEAYLAGRYHGLPSPSDIYPKDWEADVFLTQSGKPVASCATDMVWRWSITDQPANSKAAELTHADGCKVALETPTLGTYTLRGSLSRASDPTHKELAHAVGKIIVKDVLIAAVGDSNGSGEGNPSFFNKQCNRSFDSYQFQDGLRVEQADKRSSVTMIFVSCSGATIENLIDRKYAGIDSSEGSPLPPQLDQVSAAINEPLAPGGSARGRTRRTVDAVLTSIGVNNLSFGSVLKYCIASSLLLEKNTRTVAPNSQCQNQHVNPTRAADGVTSFLSLPSGSTEPTLDSYVRGSIKRLTGLYAFYKRSVVSELKTSPSNVVMTTYPDFSTSDDGSICGSVGDTVRHPFPPFVSGEWKWLQVMGNLLNHAVDASAADHFRPVDGIAPKFHKHGYCAKHSFIRPVPSQALKGNPDGPFHPTEAGHQISANANFPVLCRVLFGNSNCKSKAP